MYHQEGKSCPRCTYPLLHDHMTGVDHCHRCMGSLIGPEQIAKAVGQWAEPKMWMKQLGHRTIGQPLVCGNCNSMMSGFQVPFAGQSVVIDHCDGCGSLWFDEGEGDKLVRIVEHANRAGGLEKNSRVSLYHDPASGPRASRQYMRNKLHEEQVLASQDTMEPGGIGSYLFQIFTGLPVEVYNPPRQPPFMTYVLVFVLLIMWVAQFYFVDYLELSDEGMLAFFKLVGLAPDLVRQGDHLWGVFTHMFFHGNVIHLLGNLYFLWVFGDNVEDRIGPLGMLALFFTAGIGGALLQVAFQADPSIPVVGASGAIAGLMGAYLLFFPRVKMWLIFFFIRWRVPVVIYLGFWVLLNALGWWTGGAYVAWMAHLGGFIVGVLSGFLLHDTEWYKH